MGVHPPKGELYYWYAQPRLNRGPQLASFCSRGGTQLGREDWDAHICACVKSFMVWDLPSIRGEIEMGLTKVRGWLWMDYHMLA